jgi:hypothetical protein
VNHERGERIRVTGEHTGLMCTFIGCKRIAFEWIPFPKEEGRGYRAECVEHYKTAPSHHAGFEHLP